MIFIRLYCHYLELSLNEYLQKLENIVTKSNSVQKLYKLDQELKKGIMYNSQDKQYDLFSDIFRTRLDHHAALKTKMIRGNQPKFLTKELSKSNQIN